MGLDDIPKLPEMFEYAFGKRGGKIAFQAVMAIFVLGIIGGAGVTVYHYGMRAWAQINAPTENDKMDQRRRVMDGLIGEYVAKYHPDNIFDGVPYFNQRLKELGQDWQLNPQNEHEYLGVDILNNNVRGELIAPNSQGLKAKCNSIGKEADLSNSKNDEFEHNAVGPNEKLDPSCAKTP